MSTRNPAKQAQLKPQYIYMLEDITSYCLDPQNLATTQLIPNFEDGINAVDTKVKTIISWFGPRMKMTQGWGTQKAYFREQLAQSIFAITNPVSAWSTANNRFDLEKQMADPLTTYLSRKPNELASFATEVANIVNPLLSSLQGTGVTAASVELMLAARTAFLPYINKPTAAKDDIKSNTTMLRQLLTEALNITYFQLDRYAVQFKQMGKTDYFTNYTNRRKLKNYGTKHAFASVEVLMGDNIPVTNAVVTVENTSLTAKNHKNGHYTASPVPPGMHSITVTAPGFPNPVTTEQKEFIKGKPCYFTVMLTEFNIPAAKPFKKETVNS